MLHQIFNHHMKFGIKNIINLLLFQSTYQSIYFDFKSPLLRVKLLLSKNNHMGVFIMKLLIYNQFPFTNFIVFIIHYRCPKERHFVEMNFAMQKVSHLNVHLSIETYGHLHYHFDSFFSACAQITIVCHHRSSLVPSMLVFYYQQCMSTALWHAQAIAIFQRAIAHGQGSFSLPHIIVNAPLTLANLWQTTIFSSHVLFVIIDCHFVAMGPICTGI